MHVVTYVTVGLFRLLPRFCGRGGAARALAARQPGPGRQHHLPARSASRGLVLQDGTEMSQVGPSPSEYLFGFQPAETKWAEHGLFFFALRSPAPASREAPSWA